VAGATQWYERPEQCTPAARATPAR
jgi:hypothetical protein